MSSPEIELEFNEEHLGPMGFMDITYHSAKETVLVAHTDMDYSVGCVLIDDDRAIIAQYEQPTADRDPREALTVMGGFSWVEGHQMAAVLVQQWIDRAQIRSNPFVRPLAAKYDYNLPEHKAFTHPNGDKLPDIDNTISQMKMKRLRNSGFYIPVREIIQLAG